MTNKIAQQPLIVAENDGFKDDILKQKEFGISLTNLVKNINEPLTISINGQWGDGKTTFVKMWQGLLTSSGVHSIYFDAFANDYSDDAFISIVSTINAYADKHLEESIQSSSFFAKTCSVGKHLGIVGTKVAVKLATLGVTDGVKEIEDIEKDIANIASGATEKILKEKLLSYQIKEQTINDFKESLESLPNELKSIDNDSQALNDNPLIIIIDELDRCKPTFAIEILEKIKHLFAVENIVFVLAMNREQLEESIKSIYGANFDAYIYLQKFLTVETTLPITKTKYKEGYNDYVKKLAEYHDVEFADDDIRWIAELSLHFNLSLRQIENVFTQLVLFDKVYQQKVFFKPVLYLFIFIKLTNKQLFEKLQFMNNYEILKLPDVKKLSNKNQKILSRDLFWLFSDDSSIFKHHNEKDEYHYYYNLNNDLCSASVNRSELLPIYHEKLSVFV